MDWIKSILEKHVGEDGKLDLEKAVKEINKSAPENVVPKHKYNELSETNKQLVEDVKTRDTQLEDLKKTSGDSKELKEKIDELQIENERVKQEKEDTLREIKYDAAIEKALANAKHVDLVSGKIDRSKLKLNDDGSITGLDEQVKSLQKDYADLFEPSKTGKTPEKKATTPGEVTAEQFSKMKYAEKTKLYNENKELYDQLSGGNE